MDYVSWNKARVQGPGTAIVTVSFDQCAGAVRMQIVNLTTGRLEGTVTGTRHSTTAKFLLSFSSRDQIGTTTAGVVDMIPCGGYQWVTGFPDPGVAGHGRAINVTAAAPRPVRWEGGR